MEKLGVAIREVTLSPRLRKNAEPLGEKIRQEDGVANAIAIVERTVMATWEHRRYVRLPAHPGSGWKA